MIRLILVALLIVAMPNLFQFDGTSLERHKVERPQIELTMGKDRGDLREVYLTESLNHLDYAKRLIDSSV